MSNKRSTNANKMIKRYGEMADRYQQRIDRQSRIIDKLVNANAVYGDGLLEAISKLRDDAQPHDVADMLDETLAKVKEILAVPTDDEEQSGE